MPKVWKSLKMTELIIPADINALADKLEVAEKTIILGDMEIFYREPILTDTSVNPKISVLLLHGMAFSSKIWVELGTLKLIAAMGYRTVAVDIPGYGNSPKTKIGDDFVELLVKGLKLDKPVIVSPSLSGYYTIPHLVNHWSEMGGYIPVAPQGWQTFEKEKPAADDNQLEKVPNQLKEFLPKIVPDLSHIKTPALVVWGEFDRARNSALCSLLPNSNHQEIPKGKHPAYLSNPELWHQLIYNFLSNVSSE